MKRTMPATAFILILASSSVIQAQPDLLPIGGCERQYTLPGENTEVRGLAVDDSAADVLSLYTLDGSGKIFAYRLDRLAATGAGDLQLVESYDLSSAVKPATFSSLRGLSTAVEAGQRVFYFLSWDHSRGSDDSRLWRFRPGDAAATSVDLSVYEFRIGDRELLDVKCDGKQALVSFDASAYPDQNLRVQRGIIRIQWQGEFGKGPQEVSHLPDSGIAPARGLACMELEGARYLWATAASDHVYCAEAATGRGLFFFDLPKSEVEGTSCRGMDYGCGDLWISENAPGPDHVHRVNVTRNPDAFFEGPKVLRHLIMTIQTEPETQSANPGKVYHYYSRPYSYEQLHNQGCWPETEKLLDVSETPNAAINSFTYDPAGDAASRQYMWCVEYPDAPSGAKYSSRYEIDIWTNAYKKFVYPHRADADRQLLEDTDYLADDSELYNLSDAQTYAAFVDRVKRHIAAKYGVEADMKNPYWAARNVIEYIQDSYYYPSPVRQKPATVDYSRKHYDANPANLKIALSERDYDKTQIIACSGTSVMVTGAMRYLGIPARWLGTGTPMGSETWDSNGNGLLDAEETATCTNGHRYTQVWLGSHYGWICFDATPTKPPLKDYDPPPPLQSQWRYMTRAAGGHREAKRIVFNVGSALYRPLYRDFEYDERLAADHNCGGDQRYNLQGRFDRPELWKLAKHQIQVCNSCFVKDVSIADRKGRTRVTWQLEGAWDRIPHATVSIYLQRVDAGNKNRAKDVARVAKAVAADAKSAEIDLTGYQGSDFRVIIRRDGDPETGGMSELSALGE